MRVIVVIASSTRGFTTPRDGTPPVINPCPSTQDQDEKASVHIRHGIPGLDATPPVRRFQAWDAALILMPMSERCTCARFMHSHAYSLTVRSTLSAIARSLFRRSGRKSDRRLRAAELGLGRPWHDAQNS